LSPEGAKELPKGWRRVAVKDMADSKRVGAKHDFDPNATEPIHFTAEVEPGKYSERWTAGVRSFHKPRALLPIPPGVFDQCAHHFLENGRRVPMLATIAEDLTKEL
jgi:hypothetical protein